MRNVLSAFCVLALVVASGCGSSAKPYHVKGKLTNNGKSPLPDPKGGITITFLPLDPDAKKVTYAGAFNGDDNSYEVYAPDGKGIPKGKYKVTLNMMAPGSPVADKINDQFSPSKSPIEVDVTGDLDYDIDLAKYAK
jgi:hypothetical protein